MFKIYYKSPICYLLLHSNGSTLTKLEFYKHKINEKENQSCELLVNACKELDAYFLGKLKEFQTPLNINGTNFECKVYKALLEIPYGKTLSYKELAIKIGHLKAYRAVGNANSKNNIPIFIPCHRVLRENGIGGYTGGLEIKQFLLRLERNSQN